MNCSYSGGFQRTETKFISSDSKRRLCEHVKDFFFFVTGECELFKGHPL